MSDETKPAECTCAFPTVRARTKTGHATLCPSHARQLEAWGAAKMSDEMCEMCNRRGGHLPGCPEDDTEPTDFEKRIVNERDAALRERDALALELQSVKDALAQVVAENTANVAALGEAERKARGEEQARWHEIIGILRLRYEVAAPISGGPGYINRLSALDDVLALAPDPANG